MIEQILPTSLWTQKIKITSSVDLNNINNSLDNSKYLLIMAISDSLSMKIKNLTINDSITLKLGEIITPNVPNVTINSTFLPIIQ